MKRKPVTIRLLILTGLNVVLWTALFLTNYYNQRETPKILILQGLIPVIWGISLVLRVTEYLKDRKSSAQDIPG